MLDAFDPDLDQLVAANREQLIPIAQQVAKTERWSLSLRCAVIDCSSGLPAASIVLDILIIFYRG